MNSDHAFLKPEDYLEPDCAVCGDPAVRMIPQKRIIEKMDEYMSRRDYAGAERHLLYWLEEALQNRDQRGELMLRNELIGHYRKTAREDKALENIDRALELIKELGFEGTVSAGTTYTNSATALNAFGKNERSLQLFEKAAEIYGSSDMTDPSLEGGLYNNMALTCASLGLYERAYALFAKASDVMKTVLYGEAEQAITCLNIAETKEKELGMENAENEIYGLLDMAYELLDTPSLPRDGYYAFVCEKCAPSFSYYGYFAAAEELTKRAEEIYERA
ncbi:MAG: tetratricopeptide repeat protein [Solobacterium sp.]|nr:tetratricopeptide repeat protein [Solobacterium sp.]